MATSKEQGPSIEQQIEQLTKHPTGAFTTTYLIGLRAMRPDWLDESDGELITIAVMHLSEKLLAQTSEIN